MSRTLRTMLKCMCHSAHIFRFLYSLTTTRKLFVDNGCRSPELSNPIQYCLACRNLSIPPDVKMSSKTHCIMVAESLFLKNVSTANARCSSDQHCTMTKGWWVHSMELASSHPSYLLTPWSIVLLEKLICS
jgi:hypothetical protein